MTILYVIAGVLVLVGLYYAARWQVYRWVDARLNQTLRAAARQEAIQVVDEVLSDDTI